MREESENTAGTSNQWARLRQGLTRTSATQRFKVIVLIPALIIAVYIVVFVPDRFVSESLLVLKDSTSAAPSSDALQNFVLDTSDISKDEKILRAYLTSPQLVSEAQDALDLVEHYASSRNFLFRLSENSPREDLYGLFERYVEIAPDIDTGVLTLRVQAFTPEFSKRLSDYLVERGQNYINDVSRNIALREVDYAQQELQRAEARLKEAAATLSAFRDEHNLANPEAEGDSLIDIIYGLEAQLIESEAQLSQQRQYLNADAPQIVALKARIMALSSEITQQKSRLAGNVDGNLNQLNLVYQGYLLDAELATNLYSSALALHEGARVQVSNQLKHLVLISAPTLPERAEYPHRVYWIVTVSLLLTCLYGIVSMLVAAIREHQD